MALRTVQRTSHEPNSTSEPFEELGPVLSCQTIINMSSNSSSRPLTGNCVTLCLLRGSPTPLCTTEHTLGGMSRSVTSRHQAVECPSPTGHRNSRVLGRNHLRSDRRATGPEVRSRPTVPDGGLSERRRTIASPRPPPFLSSNRPLAPGKSWRSASPALWPGSM